MNAHPDLWFGADAVFIGGGLHDLAAQHLSQEDGVVAGIQLGHDPAVQKGQAGGEDGGAGPVLEIIDLPELVHLPAGLPAEVDSQALLVLSGKNHAPSILPEPERIELCSHLLFMHAMLHKFGS